MPVHLISSYKYHATVVDARIISPFVIHILLDKSRMTIAC